MYGINRRSNIYILAIFIILLASSIINKNYIISALFFVSVVGACFITGADSFYENIYYTLLVSSIFEYASYFPKHEKLYFFHILLAICIVLTIINLHRDRYQLKKVNKKLLGFYVLWFVYICCSFIWAESKSLNIKYIIIYAMMISFLFIVAIFNTTKERFYNSLKVIGLVFLLTIIIGMIEAMTGTQLPVKHYYDSILYKLTTKELVVLKSRPVVFFFNANNYATFLSMGIPFLLFLTYFAKSIKAKAFYGIFTLLGFTALVLTNSRSSILSIALTMIVFTLIVFKEGKIKALIYPLIIVAAFAGIYKYSYLLVSHSAEYEQKMVEKMSSMSKISKAEIGDEGSENVRVTIMYDIVTGVVNEKRVLGFGAGNSIQHLKDVNNTHGIYSVHGLAIEILGDFGIFIILYGLFYLYLLYNLFKIGHNENNNIDKCTAYALMTSLVGFTIGSFSPSSVTYFLPNWLLFALSVSFIQINNLKDKIRYEY
ncbi:O-antigen ligase family protein [Clostridium sp. JN-1]|uniref:O-antigen ligase family protein n=1 Tax=Clostridium sp. JN-1 TaxID=2483110 RepID=UPI000F0B7076|nr:O-antigen ligase family protein [Clostridium sp. JN-1]